MTMGSGRYGIGRDEDEQVDDGRCFLYHQIGAYSGASDQIPEETDNLDYHQLEVLAHPVNAGLENVEHHLPFVSENYEQFDSAMNETSERFPGGPMPVHPYSHPFPPRNPNLVERAQMYPGDARPYSPHHPRPMPTSLPPYRQLQRPNTPLSPLNPSFSPESNLATILSKIEPPDQGRALGQSRIVHNVNYTQVNRTVTYPTEFGPRQDISPVYLGPGRAGLAFEGARSGLEPNTLKHAYRTYNDGGGGDDDPNNGEEAENSQEESSAKQEANISIEQITERVICYLESSRSFTSPRDLANKIGVRIKPIYDVINVLEGIGALSKIGQPYPQKHVFGGIDSRVKLEHLAQEFQNRNRRRENKHTSISYQQLFLADFLFRKRRATNQEILNHLGRHFEEIPGKKPTNNTITWRQRTLLKILTTLNVVKREERNEDSGNPYIVWNDI